MILNLLPDTLERGKRHLQCAKITMNVNSDDPERAVSPTVHQLSSAGITRELDGIEGLDSFLSRNEPKSIATKNIPTGKLSKKKRYIHCYVTNIISK